MKKQRSFTQAIYDQRCLNEFLSIQFKTFIGEIEIAVSVAC